MLVVTTAILAGLVASVVAHPLGQLSINHYTRLTILGDGRATVHYVVDLAELPTFRETQIADTDGSGEISTSEMEGYLESVTGSYRSGLQLTVEGQPLQLTLLSRSGEVLPGQTGSAAMGLATLRLVFKFETQPLPGEVTRTWRFDNQNFSDKPGWRELVVGSSEEVSIFDSSISGNGLTEELRFYPEELLSTPLDERSGEWRTVVGPIPPGGRLLTFRNGRQVKPTTDRFLSLITVPELTPLVVLIGLVMAFALGAGHALSPGHGKALVGAYLIGTRGTARHATILGLTVTVAHTLTVYLGGLAFLLASKYVLPERLYPILSFISGALIMVIGIGLLLKRLKWSRELLSHQMHHLFHDHSDHGHQETSAGESLSTRSLFRLGISGGIIPCPTAWILMLGAISLNRTAYGLILILFFSLGLATVLTIIGILFVQGGRLIERLPQSDLILKYTPILSSIIVALIGGGIAWQALRDSGIDPGVFWTIDVVGQSSASGIAILGLGLIIGLRHALDADHLAAVSAIVCERKSVSSSLLIGGLWGLGHTISLVISGVGVILLNLQIGRYEKALEFGVALMLIGLGANVLYQLFNEKPAHLHPHQHGQQVHTHLHLHQKSPDPISNRLSIRPLLIGMVHGLAGSAGLMLVVLATINNTLLAFVYIVIFGIGSIGGMMIMSFLLGLPAQLTTGSFTRANLAIRALSGVFSLGFGLWLAYEIGYVERLLR